MKKIEKIPPAHLLLAQVNFDKLPWVDVSHHVATINERYEYWDKVKYTTPPKGLTIKGLWAIARTARKQTSSKASFGSYQFIWNLTSALQEKLYYFDLHFRGRSGSDNIPTTERNKYLISSLMEEAIASSQIEGAVTTRKQAKEMLRKNRPPKDQSERMILNNYITIQKIVELEKEDLTIERILQIHQLVTANTLAERSEEGAFRTDNDVKVIDTVTGEVLHAPPDHKSLDSLLKDLCSFFNSDKHDQFIHPIIKGCIIHFMIGFFHPFVDGNGRTARALFYWYLLKKDYWVTEYLSISKLILRSKAQYARAYLYSEIDEKDLTYFIKYQVKTLDLAFTALQEYIRLKQEEKKRMIDFLKLDNINLRQVEILEWFREEHSLILTVRETQTRTGSSNQTARTDLHYLADRGFINVISIDGKTEGFIRGEKFDIMIS